MRVNSEQSQHIFRVVLDALANPGRPCQLATQPSPPATQPLLALADLEVSVAVVGRERCDDLGRLEEAVRNATGARRARSIRSADMVLAADGISADEIGRLRTGGAADPEAGARLVIACRRIVSAADHTPAADEATRVWVQGPGASSGRLLDIEGVDDEAFEALRERNAAFPAGIDTWFVADDATIVGIPRSCRIELVAKTVRG